MPLPLFRRLSYRSIHRIIDQSIRDLGMYSTPWDCVTKTDVRRLKHALATARNEADMQRFLQHDPWFLIQHLGGGHDRWVIPQQRLGSEYVPDFLIGERHSDGIDWCAVELESPLRPMFTKSGDPSRSLAHAIRQISDWRIWLEANQNYASRTRSEGGLGLVQISPKLEGLIIISRRSSVPEATHPLRRRLKYDHRIEIRTYDFLVDSLVDRVEAISRYPDMRQQKQVGRSDA